MAGPSFAHYLVALAASLRFSILPTRFPYAHMGLS